MACHRTPGSSACEKRSKLKGHVPDVVHFRAKWHMRPLPSLPSPPPPPKKKRKKEKRKKERKKRQEEEEEKKLRKKEKNKNENIAWANESYCVLSSPHPPTPLHIPTSFQFKQVQFARRIIVSVPAKERNKVCTVEDSKNAGFVSLSNRHFPSSSTRPPPSPPPSP